MKPRAPNYASPEYDVGPDALSLITTLQGMALHQRRTVLKSWKNAGRTNKLGVLRPDRFYYKYLDIDLREHTKSLAIKKVRDLIVNGQMYLSRLADFNDPNEFRARVTLVENAVERRRYAEASARRLVKRNPGVLPKIRSHSRKIEILTSKAIIRSIENPSHAQKLYENQRDDFGVFCFCANPRSTLMWSHYANGHHGICVQFDPSRCLGVLAVAHRVTYREEIPHLIWPKEQNRIIEGLLSKSRDWSYEAEYRYTSRVKRGESIAFDASAITGLILGSRFRESTEAVKTLKYLLKERSLAGHAPLRIYQSSWSATAYDMRIDSGAL